MKQRTARMRRVTTTRGMTALETTRLAASWE